MLLPPTESASHLVLDLPTATPFPFKSPHQLAGLELVHERLPMGTRGLGRVRALECLSLGGSGENKPRALAS